MQIFAREKINMDVFMDVMGPSPEKQAQNMAKDPIVSAFFFIICHSDDSRMFMLCLSFRSSHVI